MANIDVAAANTIVASNGAHQKNPQGQGIAGDCLLFDGVAPVAYRCQGTKTLTHGRIVETGATQFTVNHALKRQASRREIYASGGLLLAGDVVFELPRLELPTSPKPGDAIFTSAGERWSVLTNDDATHSTRWRVFARLGA